MLRASRIPTFLSLVLLLASSCASDSHEASESDRRTAEILLGELQTQNYRAFATAPGWESPHKKGSTQHHGGFLDVYVNRTLADAISRGNSAPWPVGAIVVKDGWNDGSGTQAFQTAILKKTGNGVWFGAELTPSGTVIEAGSHVEECNGCHNRGSDYLLSF